jgi:hypothetical protein
VDADGAGVAQLVQLVEPVTHFLVLVQPDRKLLVFRRQRGDHADRPVEHPAVPLPWSFLICMTLSPTRVDAAAEAALREPRPRRYQGGL